MQNSIGRYQIKGELGRGGMASVYRAYDPNFSRDVAIKVLPRHFLHDPSFKDRFLTEARTIATLEHPAIVPVYDFGASEADGGSPFIVMRLLEGGSLRDKLDEYGSLPLAEAARILGRLAPALDFAHKRGVIHRDLKPGNIMFDNEGEPYLADFGIARLAEATQTMTIVGTPAFMSPEQWEGNKKLDGRSDLYAMGVIFFEMVTGRRPFVSDTPAGLMRAHLMEPVPSVLNYRKDLPVKCQPVIEKALAKDREERYQTAQSLASAVEILAVGGELPEHLTADLSSSVQAVDDLTLKQPASGHDSGATTGSATIPAPAPEDLPSGIEVVPKQRRRWPWVAGLLGIIVIVACLGIVVISGVLASLGEATPIPRSLQPTAPAINNTTAGDELILPLGFDQAYEGWLPPDSSAFFEVPITFDRPVVIAAMSPSSTDLTLTVYDDAGNEIWFVDDTIDGAEIVVIEPDDSALYILEVASYEGTAGEYLIGHGELTLDAYNVAYAISETVGDDEGLAYDIEVDSDEALIVFVSPNDDFFDPIFYIEDSFGNNYVFTDDYAEGAWEAYIFRPETDGDYVVIVEGFDTGGPYEIFVVKLPVADLN